MNLKRSIYLSASALMLWMMPGCREDLLPFVPEEPVEPIVQTDSTETGVPQDIEMFYPSTRGISYLYNGEYLPEIHIMVSVEEWNKLLDYYDADRNTKKSVSCDVRYVRGSEETVVKDAALRLRGNTSRHRPEGSEGQHHVAGNTDWHRCHFQINFRKNHKDDEHEIHGARKVWLKYFNGDSAYIREIYCFDLFRRAGVWTGEYAAYCRVFVGVEGDEKEAYYGVYCMLEPIDESFLKVREDNFGSKDGFLWKCRYGAKLNPSDHGSVGPDNEDGIEYTYELKTRTDELNTASGVLTDFVRNLNTLSGQAFHDWIGSVCDVPFLLKTYAVNVAVGMWDDYWNNSNNYYIYFNPEKDGTYRFFFIPFDYDNTLGTSLNCGVQMDAAWQSPLHWGMDSNPLIYKIIQFEDYRKIYCDELLRLVSPDIKLLYYEYSAERIRDWHAMITPYIKNDTGQGQSIKDLPASWGSRSQYRVLDPDSPGNFFKAKAYSIETYCK